MVAPFSKFYGKIWVGFCLNTLENAISPTFHFIANRKSIGSSLYFIGSLPTHKNKGPNLNVYKRFIPLPGNMSHDQGKCENSVTCTVFFQSLTFRGFHIK